MSTHETFHGSLAHETLLGVMNLPIRLRETTLGDVLAVLHREGASGVLELVEPKRRHAVHLRRGEVRAVECALATLRFGDVAVASGVVQREVIETFWFNDRPSGQRIGQCLVGRRLMTPLQRDHLLDTQRLERLRMLYKLPDAMLRFHPATPLPDGAAEQAPLRAREVFHNTPRARDTIAETTKSASEGASTNATVPEERDPRRRRALEALGLPMTATGEELRRRYKTLLLELHPDRAQRLDDRDRAARMTRLLRVMEAYQLLSRATA